MLQDIVDDDLHQFVFIDQSPGGFKPAGIGLQLPVGIVDTDTERRRFGDHEWLTLEELHQAGLAGTFRTQHGNGSHVHRGLAADRGLAVCLGGYGTHDDALH